MDFDPDSITPQDIDRYRSAAEASWGDDTRHPKYAGHPAPSSGQCYVTSAWLQSMLGGHVGSKQHHYFWVSPDRQYVLDLTGDQFNYGSMDGSVTPDVRQGETSEGSTSSLYKRADHPDYKGFRVVPEDRDFTRNPRVRLFSQRANAALSGGRVSSVHTSEGNASGSDPYPGETAQQTENWGLNEPAFHDEPDYEPESVPRQFQFVFARGELHVSPAHSHEQLLGHAGSGTDDNGPVAVGYADVNGDHATWRVESNVGLQGLREALANYSSQVGWHFDGLVGTDGQPMGLDLGPIMSYWYREKKDDISQIEISQTPIRRGKRIVVNGSVAYADQLHPGLIDWAGDLGVRLAEFPGGGNMLDHIKKQEWDDTFNNGDPNFQPEQQPLDQDPEGPFTCKECGEPLQTFGDYKLHMDEHHPREEEIEDGHFPQIQDFDEPLGFGTSPKPNDGETIAKVAAFIKPWTPGKYGKGLVTGTGNAIHWEVYPENTPNGTYAFNSKDVDDEAVLASFINSHPSFYEHPDPPQEPFDVTSAFVMVLPSKHEASRIPEFEMYSNLMGFNDDCRYYGAYRNGELLGYGVVREGFQPEVLMVQSAVQGRGVGAAIMDRIKLHYANFCAHTDTENGARFMRRCGAVNVKGNKWVYAAGEPKDMIESDVPFVFDIPTDKLYIGYAGTSTHEVPGKFSPGGIIEGYYQPGGRLVVQTASSWFWTVRHLCEVWYATAPQMEITSVEETEPDGSTVKLAAGESVGQYLRTLLQGDIAAHSAYTALTEAGGTVYAVGGAPRDALMGNIPNDIDLMVAGLDPDTVKHVLQTAAKSQRGSVTFAGKNYGVFHYHIGGDTVEIALPRSDDYQGGSRSKADITVDPHLPIDQDLLRRDFTANAIATNLSTGELHDPFNGADDIKRGVLRTTHPNSFREDPSRLVRALTMSGRYGLMPDERTRHEMETEGHLLRGESPDLLNKVITKMFTSDNPARAIRLAHDTGLLKHLFPEVHDNWDFDQNNAHHHHPLGNHLLQVLDNVSRLTTDPDVRMAALLHDIGKPKSAWTDPVTGQNHYYTGPNGEGGMHEDVGAKMAEERLARTFNLQRSRISRISHLIQHHTFPAFNTTKGARRFVARVGDEHADDLLNLREADQTGKGQSPEEVAAKTSVQQQRDLVNQVRLGGQATGINALSVNGNDILQMGLKPGPQVGAVLNSLMQDVLEDPSLNQRDLLLQRAQEYVNAQPQ